MGDPVENSRDLNSFPASAILHARVVELENECDQWQVKCADVWKEVAALRLEVKARREAMHSIYWLNLSPNIDAICKTVYERFPYNE